MSGDVRHIQKQILTLMDIARRSAVDDAEGRNAAVQACRLVHQHGFLVVQPSELVTLPPPPSPPIVTPAPRAPRQPRPRRSAAEVRTVIRETATTVEVAGDAAERAGQSIGRAIATGALLLDLLRRR